MYASMLHFEWRFINRNRSFYAILVFFVSLGVLMGTVANFSYSNSFYNGSYVLNGVIGITSLLCIFSTTLLAAQTLFREKESDFDSILFATPLRKMPYVASRFTIIFFVNAAAYFLFVTGLFVGQILRSPGNESFGSFHLIYYLQPYLVLLIPNILFCIAVACCIGLLTGSKMLVYVSGVFIYFLYWGISFYTNSPLIANSAPVTAESMRLAAIVDPFGIASFLEQTYYWSAVQRNSQLLQLKGNFLINRLLYLLISLALLAGAYVKFNFTIKNEKATKRKSGTGVLPADQKYVVADTCTTGLRYDFKAMTGFLRIELKNILTSIPVWIVIAGWVGFFMLEAFSDIEGNSRIPEKFATTGLIVKNILSGLPLIALMVLLFFGNEIYWRSAIARFNQLENATPVKRAVVLLSQWLSLSFVGLFLILVSICSGLVIQLIKGTAAIEWQLYFTLFYLVGLPLALNAGLIICIQAMIKNRWMGIFIAGVFIFLMHTSLGKLFLINHPLLKFANTYQGDYSSMNGFGNDFTAFGFYMLFWTGISVIVFLVAVRLNDYKRNGKNSLPVRGIAIATAATIVAVVFGVYIFRETKLESGKDSNNRMESYERNYQWLKTKPQLSIATVATDIDLFPSRNGYRVEGFYHLVNNSVESIDSVFINAHRSMRWRTLQIENGVVIKADEINGVYIFRLKRPASPGDSVRMQFEFAYEGSAFNRPAGFNTIINNGSFVRISRFFPTVGFNDDDQIEDAAERRKRGLPPVMIKALEAPGREKKEFIQLDMTVSTNDDQLAIGVGKLIAQWKKQGRNYYRYITPAPVPFRFAVSSGNYSVLKAKYGNLDMELYYSPKHGKNARHLLAVAKESANYFEKNFGPYPFDQLRLVEISSITKGFAGTAYPASLFINENFGFQNLLEENPEKDILNEMVSHEISHSWWGNAAISPDEREGSSLLTETLAMYSELMIYKKMYGDSVLVSRVNVHKDIYLSSRAGSDEEPLHRLNPQKPHLSYDKGMVVMYQMYKLLGEEKLNLALRNFYNKYAYPNTAPVSTDLLNELYNVASPVQHLKIDEWFKKIVTYDIQWEKAAVSKTGTDHYRLELAGKVERYDEDGKGNSRLTSFNDSLYIDVIDKTGYRSGLKIPVDNGKFSTVIETVRLPDHVTADPYLLLLTRDEEAKTAQVRPDK